MTVGLLVFCCSLACVLVLMQIGAWCSTNHEPFVIEHVRYASTGRITNSLGLYGDKVRWHRSMWHSGVASPTYARVEYEFWGFDYYHELDWHRYGNCNELHTATVPLWFVLVLSLIFPVRWVWLTFRRREEVPERACESCGYDLRAHSVGQRCPECGVVTAVDGSPKGDR